MALNYIARVEKIYVEVLQLWLQEFTYISVGLAVVNKKACTLLLRVYSNLQAFNFFLSHLDFFSGFSAQKGHMDCRCM